MNHILRKKWTMLIMLIAIGLIGIVSCGQHKKSGVPCVGVTQDNSKNFFDQLFGNSDKDKGAPMECAAALYLLQNNGTSNYTVTSFAGSGTQGSTDGTGTSASFSSLKGLSLDSSGNIFVADSGNNKIRKVTSAGVVSTLAGSGTAGATEGTGTAATFNNPYSVTVDSNGNVYVADPSNHKIRKITSAGVVTTYSGSGTAGATEGTGTAATFNSPFGVTVDSTGNLYVADTLNNKIRAISTAIAVTTFAGSGTAGATDATGTSSTFYNPYGVAVDTKGIVYVADTLNHKIRKITSAGVVTTLAGSGTNSSTDGTGTSSTFSSPCGIAVDSSFNVYVTDSGTNKIRKITSAAVVTTIAGIGTAGSTDGDGANASFSTPCGIAVNSTGDIYVADTKNHKIRKLTKTTTGGGTGTGTGTGTGAGTGTGTGTGTGSTTYSIGGTITGLTANGLVLQNNTADDLTISSGATTFTFATKVSGAYSVTFKTQPTGLICTLTSGSGTATANVTGVSISCTTAPYSGSTTATRVYCQADFSSNSSGTTATTCKQPTHAVADSSGNVYISDMQNSRVLYFPAGSTTATDVYGQAGSLTSGTASTTSTGLSYPYGLALTSNGGLYVSDLNNHRVLYFDSGSKTATVVYGHLGSFTNGLANNGGAVSANTLNQNTGVVLDESGGVYVPDQMNNRVLFYASGSTVATRVYGQANYTSSVANKGLGAPTADTINQPTGVALDSTGGLYVADDLNHRVLYYTSGSTTASRVYGQGGSFITATSNKGGISADSLYAPTSVALDSFGGVYIADNANHRVLYYPSGSTTATRVYGQNGSFTTATANNGGVSANSLNGPTFITIRTNGLFIADSGNHRILYFQ